MLTEAMRRPLKVLAVTVAVDHVVDRLAIALTRHLGGAIGQELDIAREDQLDRALDAAVALRELLVGFGGDLRHSIAIRSPCAEVRSRDLFPGELFYCYHGVALSSTKGVV